MPVPRWVLLGLILLIGYGAAYLRFHELGRPAMWLDEIIHLDRARRASMDDLRFWIFGPETDPDSGPLYYATLRAGLRLVQTEEAGVRLAPAAFGTVSVVVLTAAGWLLGGPVVGIVTGILMATSPLHVYYSREGRLYSLLVLCACVILLVLLSKRERWLPVAQIALLVAAYAGVVSIPMAAAAVCAAGGLYVVLWCQSGRGDSKVLGSGLSGSRRAIRGGLFVGFLLVLYWVLYYVDAGLWLGPGAGKIFVGVEGRELIATSPFSVLALQRMMSSLAVSGLESTTITPLSIGFWTLAGVGIFCAARKSLGLGLVVTTMLVLPVVLAHLALGVGSRWFSIRYTSPALPAFLLAVSFGLVVALRAIQAKLPTTWSRSQGLLLTAAITATVLLSVPNLAAARREPYMKVDWRAVVEEFERYAVDGDQVITSNGWTRICLEYYLQRSALELEVLASREEIPRAERLSMECDGCWLIVAGYHTRPEIKGWMDRAHLVWRTDLEDLKIYFHPDFEGFVDQQRSRPHDRGRSDPADPSPVKLEFTAEEAFLRGDGWSTPEVSPDGLTFIWAVARHAELALPVTRVADHTLRLRVLAFDFPGAAIQTLEARLGSQSLGVLELETGWQELEVPIAEHLLDVGLNLMTLDFGRSTAPAEVVEGSTDGRPLSVAFDYLKLEPVAAADAADP